ncbi:MAG: 23S rRNA pseudouridine(1911/1915/1917) synthase RluD [Pseudomonadales bacterium]
MIENIKRRAQISEAEHGIRLDQAAAVLFPEFSRARLQLWIKSGQLCVDGKTAKPKEKVYLGNNLVLDAELEQEGVWLPMKLDLDISYEDEDILVLNKPAGLVVHPAAGHANDTLLNALLHHCPELETVPRAGIVHRLDKDTTGLLVIAKNLMAHNNLVEQLQARTVKREYEAIACGVMSGGGKVEKPLGRHPTQRKKIAVLERGGKEAITRYRVLKRFLAHTHIAVQLETGRTHQIRVHMAHLRYPLLGDPVYGGRMRLPPAASAELQERIRSFGRQALHARRLGLVHPASGEDMSWEAELPTDMAEMLLALAAHTAGA